MSESINTEFEAYVKAELGDIAVVSEGRYISPKIQNYFKVWNHQQSRITELQAQLADAKQVANDCRIVADNAIAEALGEKKPDCVWTYDIDQSMYDTSCGEAWRFDEGFLKDHSVKFCPFCAGQVKEST